MAQTIYTYSIINDTFSGTIIPDLLQDEILTTAIATAIEYINVEDDVITIYFVDPLIPADETTLTECVNIHGQAEVVIPPVTVESLSAGSGSAAAPPYSFTGDKTTGLYRAAQNTLAFSAGGSDKIKFDTTIVQLMGEVQFTSHPSSRADGITNKSLYVDGTGNLQHGAIDHNTLTNTVPAEHVDHSTVSVVAGDGLTGGGDLTASRTINVVGTDSIAATADAISLVNDVTAPGNNQVYGTNGSGVKGWKSGDYVDRSSAQSIAGSKTFTSDMTITGNLIVSGTTTSVNSNEVNIGDSIITLNYNEAGTPSQNGGIEIERGTSTNAQLVWDEATDKWSGGLVGALVALSYEGHTHTEVDITDLDKYTTAQVDGFISTLNTTIDGKEAVFVKNTAFNKDFGTIVGTVTQGNDARLSDARTPTAHTHVKADVTDFSDADYATATQGATADTASQPGHAHIKSDITDFVEGDYATAVQGTKADTASQPGHAHIKSDITDFVEGDYATAVQGTKADTALQNITGELLADLSNVSATAPTEGQVLTFDTTNGWQPETLPAGITDHGLMSGLGDDDHSQYHNDARGDVRYNTKSEITSLLAGKEDSFVKNTAFNKNFGAGSGTVVQGNDGRLSNARPPTAHTHLKSEITDFSDGDYATPAQGAKADTALQNITGEILSDLSNVAATAPADGQVLTFDTTNGWQPETITVITDHGLLTGRNDDDHTQYHTDARGDIRYNTKSEITSFLSGKEAAFTKNTAFNKDFGTTTGTLIHGNDSRLSDARTPTAHTHVISDTTGLQTALDGKSATSHTHTIANVTSLQTTLDGKAASSHTHTIANTTGLQTALDGKAAIATEVPSGGTTGQVLQKTSATNYAMQWATPAGGAVTSHDRQMDFGTTLLSTTSTSYVDVGNMTVTTKNLGGAGNYNITFSCRSNGSNRGMEIGYILNIDGVDVTGSYTTSSVARDAEGTTEMGTISLTWIATGITTGTVIKVRWKVSNFTGYTVHRRLVIDGILATNVI